MLTQTVAGRTFDDCQEIYGDSLAQTVNWADGSDLGKLAGEPVRLRFRLNDADLYSLRFNGA